MLDGVRNRFTQFFNKIGSKVILTEKDLEEILREVRVILLEGDVSLKVVKIIIEDLKQELINKEYTKSISPKQVVFKALKLTLLKLLSAKKENSSLNMKPITYYMLVGLQGVGKTTTVAKLGYLLKRNYNKKVLLVGLDISRLAAYEQLSILSNNNDLDFFSYDHKEKLEIVLQKVMLYAKENYYDVVILDTAGRLAIDTNLIGELQYIYSIVLPKELLLVIDSLMGQSALTVARSFQEKLQLTGIIITRADADNRGGAVLSVSYETNLPIKLVGEGEQVNQLAEFNPEKVVNSLLNVGDIQSLLAGVENEFSQEEVKNAKDRLVRGVFNLNDYKKQILSINKMQGGLGGMLSMIPGIGKNIKKVVNNENLDTNLLKKQLAIINSMTPLERKKVEIISFSRKKRIANGSGTTLADINILLKQFTQMAKVFKKMKGGQKNPQDLLKSLGMNR